MSDVSKYKGPIAWMAKNSVASNLFMFVLVFAGLVGLFQTKQEVLPEFDLGSRLLVLGFAIESTAIFPLKKRAVPCQVRSVPCRENSLPCQPVPCHAKSSPSRTFP